jgi:hypothetical protein
MGLMSPWFTRERRLASGSFPSRSLLSRLDSWGGLDILQNNREESWAVDEDELSSPLVHRKREKGLLTHPCSHIIRYLIHRKPRLHVDLIPTSLRISHN